MTPPAAKQTAPRREIHETDKTGPGNRRGWKDATLGQLVGKRGKSINPAKTPEEKFELYSVPSFPDKKPEVVFGKEIGSNKQCVEPYSVLLCKINPRINRVWVVGNFTRHMKIASTEWIVFPPIDEVAPDFLCYHLQQNVVRDFLAHNASGVGGSLMRVKALTLRDFPFAYPPLSEQRQIVAEIEKQFTRLDAGVGALKRVQANLKRYRAAVLKAACSGQLVPTEAVLAQARGQTSEGRDQFETGEELLKRILEERRKNWQGRGKYKEPSSIESGTLPFAPEGWTIASAESVCSSVRDGTHDTPLYVQDGVPLITSKNLLPTGLDFENVKLIARTDHIEIGKRSGVERGDILFAMIGTIGNPVVVETDCEFSIKNVGLFKANPEFISSRYLRYWFMSPPFTRWLEPKQRGTTQKFVPLGLLRALAVALPPLAEQTRIVAEVERRLSVVEELEAVVSANLQRAARLRQAILKKAFEGELIGHDGGHDVSCPSSSCPAAGQARAKERV